MKNNIITLVLLIVGISSSSLAFIFYNNNIELVSQIEKQEKLLTDVSIRDSVYTEKTKAYSTEITKYINNCEFTYDGKKVSTAELVKLMNSSLQKSEMLKDSVAQLKSIQLAIVQFMYDHYGIKIEMESNKEGTHLFIPKFSKADSGLLLLPYYRENLIYDSTTKNWKIVLPPKFK